MSLRVFLLIVAAVFCGCKPRSNSELRTRTTLSIDGIVLLFYKEGERIIIRRCKDHTTPKTKNECIRVKGVPDAKPTVDEFRLHLKSVIQLGSYHYSKDTNRLIESYRKSGKQDINLEAERARLKRKLSEVGPLFFGLYPNHDRIDKLAKLKKEIGELDKRISSNAQKSGVVRQIDKYIDDIVKYVSVPEGKVLYYNDNRHQVTFNVLNSYFTGYKVFSGPSVFEFTKILPGEFVMGFSRASKFKTQDSGSFKVKLSKGFHLQKTEVTQEQWIAVMGFNPSKSADTFKLGKFAGEPLCKDLAVINRKLKLCVKHPVTNVTWNDVQVFIYKVNNYNPKSKFVYRLPTEAEWEYAARGGTTTDFAFGDANWQSNAKKSRFLWQEQLDPYAWCQFNSFSESQKVATRKPYPPKHELYDMLGSAAEYTSDWYSSYPKTAETVVDYRGKKGKSNSRVIRGGSFFSFKGCHPSHRVSAPPDKDFGAGFRLVRVLKSQLSAAELKKYTELSDR